MRNLFFLIVQMFEWKDILDCIQEIEMMYTCVIASKRYKSIVFYDYKILFTSVSKPLKALLSH